LGVLEKDIALEIAQQLKERLMAYNHYKVLLTRESDVSMSLNDRILFANNNNADIFISIHVNYFPREQKNFIETYYFGPTRDVKAKKLAAVENADSHYSYAELKEVLQKIGDTLKLQESKQLAVSVQSNLFHEIVKIDKKTSNHGVKSAPFIVLLGLDAPSILTEVTCLCNQREEERLGTTEYRNDIATFLEQGIVNYLNKNTQLGGKRNGEKEKLAQAQ
jgi:N-acetylmuramoyl-L-alanine amidase